MDFHPFRAFRSFVPTFLLADKGRRCKEAVSHLAGLHANDTRELEVLLCQAHALGPVGNVTLAHLPALLVLYHAEHPERPVLPCNQTAAGSSPACFGHELLLSTQAPNIQAQVHEYFLLPFPAPLARQHSFAQPIVA